jgi:hypothetical protein
MMVEEHSDGVLWVEGRIMVIAWVDGERHTECVYRRSSTSRKMVLI